MLKKTLKGLCSAAIAASLTALSVPAHSSEAMLDLLKILRDKGSISAEEYELLVNAAKADEEKANAVKQEAKDAAKEEVAEISKGLPDINTKGKLELKSRDGDHSFRIGGRLQWDTTFVNDDGSYSGSSEQQFRRARLYLSGTTFKYWDFKFQFDFEDTQDSDQAIEDAYIRYTGWPVKVTLGQRKTPYSMHELTSSKYIAFVERSMASELFDAQAIGVGNREMGVTLTHKWNNFLIEGGYYFMRMGGCISGPAGAECKLDDGQGFTGRLVWADYDSDERTLIHAGIAGGYKDYDNGVARFRVRPNVSEGDRIVDSDGVLPADSYHTYNLQLAGMYKRFWANGEYYYGSFDLPAGTVGDDSMEGYYVQAGVFLTDDSRRYKNGAWDSVKPKSPVGKGGYGAWEIAARYDGVMLGEGINGGAFDEEGNTFSVALNWYPINNIRFQANYVNVDCEGISATNDLCDWGDGDPDFFIVRSQIFF